MQRRHLQANQKVQGLLRSRHKVLEVERGKDENFAYVWPGQTFKFWMCIEAVRSPTNKLLFTFPSSKLWLCCYWINNLVTFLLPSLPPNVLIGSMSLFNLWKFALSLTEPARQMLRLLIVAESGKKLKITISGALTEKSNRKQKQIQCLTCWS